MNAEMEDLAGMVEYPYEPAMNDRRPEPVERLAAKLAWERGGQTHPLCDFDLDRAEEIITGQTSLRAENARLRSILQAVVDRTTVGKPGSMALRSRFGSYPAELYHRARAALASTQVVR